MSAFVLNSNRLRVEIDRPGEVYKGSRFDRSSFISQVTLDGKHSFCVPESLAEGEGTGGSGLCCGFETLGYDEAAPGERFPLIGVGLLERIDGKEHSIFTSYPFTPFPFSCEQTGEELRIVQEPLECGGYAFRLERVIRAEGNRLTVSCSLENRGGRVIETTEYAHNFVAVNRRPLGPDYSLRLGYRPDYERKTGDSVHADDQGLHWSEVNGVFFGAVKNAGGRNPHAWELKEKQSGAGITERSLFPALRFHLWGKEHVASPEIFVRIHIAPGETFRWGREYEFNA